MNFLEFLKDNGINIEDFESRLIKWDTVIYEEEPHFWTIAAFNWGKQPEKRGFWFGLHIEWFKICKNGVVCYGKDFPRVS